MNKIPLEDSELITAYQASHNKEYIGILFKRYMTFVLGVCMKYLHNPEKSKDATMQIFESLFISLLKQNQPIQNFQAWIYTISKNHCFMQLRKKQVVTVNDEFIFNKAVENQDFSHLTEETDWQEEKIIQNLPSAITQLAVPQQQCIQLFYLEQKSYQEIMAQTGYNFKEVKSHIQNGKRNLKNILNPLHNEK